MRLPVLPRGREGIFLSSFLNPLVIAKSELKNERHEMEKLPVLHPVSECPGCGWPSLSDKKGRMMCCEGFRISDVPKIRNRRCSKRGTVTPGLQVAEPGGGSVPSPTLSSGQLKLFEMEK